ncbi:helix-turn-helix transcriptional regulator [Lentibacter algarum]|uniref:helix-turn-helix transcriptional regulator n=1 Tax=Lentibacter algarum TaxID=576131 RepID=UPI001C08D292|nr:helix-turn-helix transcriptional regulator [Lentibacter algarum]MBU2982942.1 helix-turn-helix transcriptional regulator [Lentibacter algarum]
MQPPLLSFPLPILVFVLSCVACVLTARLDLGRRFSRNLFIAFFALTAVSALLVGLRFGYGFERLVVLQRCLPLYAAPLVYLGFSSLAFPPETDKQRIGVHLAIATIALVVSLSLQSWDTLDIAIGISYLAYAVALLRLWRKGANYLAYVRLEMAPSLHKWTLWSVGFLLVNFTIDTAIALSFAFGREDNAMTLISYGSLSLLAGLLTLILSVSANTRDSTNKTQVTPENDEAHIEEAARNLLVDNELYLDTELSLERLAKRLHVPARSLSSAINQTKQMNVSQYVNSFRLDHAAMLLRESDVSVSKVMERSGFLTRSNFYREFQRVFGCSPAQYRTQSGG